MRLGLSDGVSISSLGVTGSGMSDGRATLTIDDVNLHECVRWQEGSKTPTFTFFAPDGEFTLLKYRIRSTFRPPITVQPILETQVLSTPFPPHLLAVTHSAGEARD